MSNIGKYKVLVTRPQPGAEQTADKLQAIGFDAITLPFTEMVPLSYVYDAKIDLVDAVIVTSANALRHANELMLRDKLNLPVYVVGDATKQAAELLGFNNVVSANGTAKDLVDLIAHKVKSPGSFLYLCGQTRTSDIEDFLNVAGFDCHIVETYQTKKVSQLTYKLSKIFQTHNIDAVLLYSRLSAEIYNNVWATLDSNQTSVKPSLFCISGRAKSVLSVDLKIDSNVCSAARDDVMIETLRTHFEL